MQRSLGSGVIVDPSGLVVTNYHVIEGASEVKVALADKREFDAEIVLKDERSDLAVLRIKGANERFPALEFGNSDELQVGDVVLAIGDPFGVGQTVTHGIVSALARTQVGITDYQFFIQTDAAINPGNSGGALVDMNGRLVGINTAIYSRSGGSQGIGFAIPANMVRVVVASAKGGSAAVKRPWLGAKLQEVTPEIAESLGLKRPSGALVASVVAGGPAARAGIKTGDLIVSIDGDDRRRSQRLRLSLRHQAAGRHRADRPRPPGPGDGRAGGAASRCPRRRATRSRSARRSPFLGATVANLSPALADELRLDPQSEGVVITAVADGSTAQSIGFQKGDIVVSVNNQKIAKIGRSRAHQPMPAAGSGASPSSAAASRFRSCSADECSRAPEAKSTPSSVRGRRPRARRAAAARRQAAAGQARRRGRAGSSARPRRRAHAHAGDALARLAHLLGAARHRQDHGGAAAGAGDRSAFRADLGDLLRRRRPQEGVRRRARRGARPGRGRCSSSTRSTASTARSRIPSCR